MREVTGGFDPRVFDKVKIFEYLDDLLCERTEESWKIWSVGSNVLGGDLRRRSLGVENSRTRLILNSNILYAPKPHENITVFIQCLRLFKQHFLSDTINSFSSKMQCTY